MSWASRYAAFSTFSWFILSVAFSLQEEKETSAVAMKHKNSFFMCKYVLIKS